MSGGIGHASDLPSVSATPGFRTLERVAQVSAVAGAALSVVAFFTDPRRFAFAYLAAFAFVIGTSTAALFFVALQHVTRAGWSTTVRRIAENLAAPVALALPLFVLLCVFGVSLSRIYPWSDPANASAEWLVHKVLYLNVPFFIARGVAFGAAWLWLFRTMVGRSIAQDSSKDAALTARNARFAAPAIVVYAFTTTFASFDWLMSLEPRWSSTIFGVYNFAGNLVAALALIALVAMALRRTGMADLITIDVLHDLGKLLFGFIVFWGYIAFSQYMLIWYANEPEETLFFRARWGGWLDLSLLLAVAQFAVPFFALLSRTAKRTPKMLAAVCAWVLVIHFADIYWLVAPNEGDQVGLGWIELGPLALLVGAAALWVLRRFRIHAPIAVGDPYLPEVLGAHSPKTDPPPPLGSVRGHA